MAGWGWDLEWFDADGMPLAQRQVSSLPEARRLMTHWMKIRPWSRIYLYQRSYGLGGAELAHLVQIIEREQDTDEVTP